MTVAELIKELEKLDPNLRVLVDGYEDGYADVASIRICTFRENVNDTWYQGSHDMDFDDGCYDYDDYKKFEGIILSEFLL